MRSVHLWHLEMLQLVVLRAAEERDACRVDLQHFLKALRHPPCTGRGISSSISNVPLIQLIQLILPKSGPRLLQY